MKYLGTKVGKVGKVKSVSKLGQNSPIIKPTKKGKKTKKLA